MFKNFSSLILIDSLTKILSFLFVPLITNSISIEDFGLYKNALEISILLLTIVLFGLPSAYARYITLFKNDDSIDIYGVSISRSFLGALLLTPLLLPVLDYLGYSKFQCALVIVITLCSIIVSFARVDLIYKHKITYVVKYVMLQSVSFYLIIVVFDRIGLLNLTSVLASYALSLCMTVLYLLRINIRKYNLRFSISYARSKTELLEFQNYRKESYRISILTYLSGNYDKFLIAILLTNTELGMYGIITMLGSVIRTFCASIINIAQPLYIQAFDRNAKKEQVKLNKSIRLILALTTPLFVIYMFLVEFFVSFLGAEYQAGIIVPCSLYGMYIIVESFSQIRNLNTIARQNLKWLRIVDFTFLVSSVLVNSCFFYFLGFEAGLYSMVFLNILKHTIISFFNRDEVVFKRLTIYMAINIIFLIILLGLIEKQL